MSTQSLSSWLRCPNCFLPLESVVDAAPATSVGSPGPATLGCPSGHRYDVNRRGFVTLLPPRSRVVGDSTAMLDARDALLRSGAYSPIADALLELLHAALPASEGSGRGGGAVRARAAQAPSPSPEPTRELRVLDSGCGTGWYLRRLLDGLHDAGRAARGLASDLSPAAVQRAVRGRQDIDGLVSDVHAPLPLRDGTADVVTAVFAPRNPAEFARALSPEGLLLIVVPKAEHLAELRAVRPDMLSVPDGKADALIDELAPLFTHLARRDLRYPLPLDADRAAQLIGMGPSAHHVVDSGRAAMPASPLPAATTVAVDILAFRQRPR